MKSRKNSIIYFCLFLMLTGCTQLGKNKLMPTNICDPNGKCLTSTELAYIIKNHIEKHVYDKTELLNGSRRVFLLPEKPGTIHPVGKHPLDILNNNKRNLKLSPTDISLITGENPILPERLYPIIGKWFQNGEFAAIIIGRFSKVEK